jgi:hypothetical protein
LLAAIIASNIFVAILYYAIPSNFETAKSKVGGLLQEYRFNAYIKYYMLIYYDLTYFAIMKFANSDSDKDSFDKLLTFLGIVVICTSIVIPLLLMTVIFKRFSVLRIKETKRSFNVLI